MTEPHGPSAEEQTGSLCLNIKRPQVPGQPSTRPSSDPELCSQLGAAPSSTLHGAVRQGPLRRRGPPRATLPPAVMAWKACSAACEGEDEGERGQGLPSGVRTPGPKFLGRNRCSALWLCVQGRKAAKIHRRLLPGYTSGWAEVTCSFLLDQTLFPN